MDGTIVPRELLVEFANHQLTLRGQETCEKIREALKNIEKFKLGEWSPPIKDANGKHTTKFCRECCQQRPLEAYQGSDRANQCNACRRNQQKTREATKGISTKTCDACQTEKPISSFDTGHKSCNTCRNSEQTARNRDNPEKTPEALLAAGNHPAECNICAKAFNKDEFGFASDKCCWKGTCRECLNAIGREREYKAIQWAKGKEEGGIAFLAEMAKRCKAFRDNNPDKQRAYVLRQSSDMDAVIKRIKSGAPLRSIIFVEDDYDALALKLLEPCAYCGRESDPNADDEDDRKLNGLDRVNSKGAYSNANTVAACKVCNHMKKTKDVEEFHADILDVYEFNKCQPTGPIAYSTWKAKGARFGFVKGSDKLNAGDPETTAARELIRESEVFKTYTACYLCNSRFTDDVKATVDRIDPMQRDVNHGYTHDNTAAACWSCNEMKSDLDVNLFKLHCAQVSKFSPKKPSHTGFN